MAGTLDQIPLSLLRSPSFSFELEPALSRTPPKNEPTFSLRPVPLGAAGSVPRCTPPFHQNASWPVARLNPPLPHAYQAFRRKKKVSVARPMLLSLVLGRVVKRNLFPDSSPPPFHDSLRTGFLPPPPPPNFLFGAELVSAERIPRPHSPDEPFLSCAITPCKAY